MEARLDGRSGQLERLGDFGEAHRGEGVQADDLGLFGRQAVEQGAEPPGFGFERALLFVGDQRRGELLGGVAPAQQVVAAVCHHAEEVGFRAPDGRRGGGEPKEGLLDDILGIAPRGAPQGGEAEKRLAPVLRGILEQLHPFMFG